MIIARAPLRISFAGGGTDIPSVYKLIGGGAVVSTSINRYVYVTVNKKFDGRVSVRYRIHENVDNVAQLRHPLIREILLSYKIYEGIEIVIISEVPARGSGLGASSALGVALCACLEKYVGGHVLSPSYFASCAANIEIKKVGSPIGKQDHYASALGGLNLIKFYENESVSLEQFQSGQFFGEIESQSMLFYLNMEHDYKDGHFVQRILKDQISNPQRNRTIYELQRHNAEELWNNMQYEVIERFMDHINENWRLKKSLHLDISNPLIDKYIESSHRAGATAAKVCGAGGGGFLYLLVPPDMQDSVREALDDLNELDFKFDQEGVKVIFEDKENYATCKS